METERLRIRALRAEDAEALYAVLSDAAVMRFIEAPFTLRQTADFIARVNAASPPLARAVIWKESGALIGQLIYHPYDSESWELGWILHREFWGRGIAGELTAAVIEDAERKKIPELVIECDPAQSVTRRLAEKHGFRYTGREGGLAVYHRRMENA